jgi:hypothetical protein
MTYQACVNSRIAEAKFPIEVSGAFCGPHFARDEILRFIKDDIWQWISNGTTEQKVVILQAVSILGHPDIIDRLEKVINDSNQPTIVRTKAVFAFKRLAQSSTGNDAVSDSTVKQTVLPKLMSFIRSSLPTPVRMAAVALVISSEHSKMSHFQEIAKTVVDSRNVELESFWASSIESMSQMKAVTHNHRRMQHIAEQLRSQVQQLRGAQANQGYSQNLYYAEEIGEKTEVEFFARFGLIKSNSSHEFLHLFTKGALEFGEDPLELTPFAMSLSFQSKTNDIWRQSNVFTTVSLWNEMFITKKLSADSLQTIVKGTELGRMIYVWLDEMDQSSLHNKVEKVSFQKAIQPWEQVREVPTILGFPVNFRMSMPIIFSTVGQVGIKGTGAQARVQAEVYLSLVGQMKTRLTLKVPFTEKYYQVGYERNLAVELPLRILAQKTKTQAIQFAITPTHLENHGQPSGEIRIVSYDHVPYSAVIKDQWARTVSERYESFDLIRTGKQNEISQRFGQEEIGIKMKYEHVYDKVQSSSDYKKWSPVLYKNLNLTMDLSASRTNTILVTVGVGRVADLSPSSASSSQSDSNESSDSTQGNSVEIGPDMKRGYVLAVALTGKRGVVQSLDKKATTIDEIDNQQAKNTFQYLFQAAYSKEGDAVWARVARGAAADKVATTMPQSGGLRVVRQAITESDTNQQQGAGCFQMNYKIKDVTKTYFAGKTTLEVGQTCAASDLHELKLETIVKIADEIEAQIEVKNTNVPHSLQQAAQRLQQWTSQSQSHDSPVKVHVATSPLRLTATYAQRQHQRQRQPYQQWNHHQQQRAY